MPRLVLSLFGSFQAILDGWPVTAFESDKARALLVYLAVESDRPHTREKLAGLLWPDSTEAAARASLSQALANLRYALGDREADPPSLLASRQSIQFNREADATVDVIAFQHHLSAARHPPSPRESEGISHPPSAIGHQQSAVGLYRGRFLEGFSLPGCPEFEEWLLLEQEHLHRLAMEALARLADACEAWEEFDRALPFAWRQLELDPWWERAHRQAMRLLARSGQRDAALAQYQACCRLLAEELAAEPSLETVRLYEEIRDGKVPAEPPGLDVPPAPLPGYLTGGEPAAARPVFVAREGELAWLDRLLQAALAGRGQAAFVVGGPRRGKTMLLHEFARRALDAHPDLLLAMGTCNAYTGMGDPYLPFRGVLSMLTGDAEAAWAAGTLSVEQARRSWDALPDVAPVLAARGSGLVGTLLPGRELLGRARAAAPDGAEWLPALRRLADPRTNPPGGLEQSHLFEQYANVLLDLSEIHPLLLILDDLQWADPSSIGLLFHLGRRIERGRILLAGAYRPDELAIGRDGERHPLEPALADYRAHFGDAWRDLAASDEAEGRAFVDRFVDSEPNALDERFRDSLYGRTRGHALFTVELLRAMQGRGDLVRDGEGRWTEGERLEWDALPARAEAAIAERVDRLAEELRELLVVASVEGEEFTAQAVARVQGMDELHTMRLLRGQLAVRHRLVREQGEVRLDGRSLSRYRFTHLLVQQHLYQGLGEGERRLLHRRVGEALEGLYEGRLEEAAVQLVRHFAGDLERERRYARLAGERAATQYANEEALRYLGRALELTPAGACGHRYELLVARESVYHLVGQRDAQRKDLLELETLAGALGLEQQAEVAMRMARLAIMTCDHRAAMAAAETAVERAQATGQAGVQAEAHHFWAAGLHHLGDVTAAQTHWAEALALARTCGQRNLEALALSWLAECAADPAQELRYWEEALCVAVEAGDRRIACDIRDGLSASRVAAGDLARGRTGLEQCLRDALQQGNRLEEGYALRNLASYYEAVGDYARSKGCCRRALCIAGEVENPRLTALVLGCRASASLALGDLVGARQDAEQCLQLACNAGLAQLQGLAHQELGDVCRQEGDPAAARAHYAQAFQLLIALGLPGLTLGALSGLAWTELAQGRIREAQDRAAEILALLDGGYRPGADDKLFLIYLTCYQVLTAAGDPRAAELLTWAHFLLQEWAANAPDEETRRSFLENVAENREIAREWQRAHPGILA